MLTIPRRGNAAAAARHGLVQGCRVAGLVAAAALLATGCRAREPVQVMTTKPPVTPALFETGRRLYAKQCATCHGAQGAGDGPAAYLLYPKPRDFTQNEFRLVSTSSMEAADEDLFQTITRGMPGSAMPPWDSLSPEERWALVSYVRSLAEEPRARQEGRISPETPADGIPWSVRESLMTKSIDPDSLIQVPPETPNNPEGIARGRQLFREACASCHGPEGKGDGQQVMTDNQGFPIKPRNLTAGIFKGSSESRDLYYRIVAGLPGSPMPSYAGVYTDEQLWDLIHYVQSLVPQGVEERVRLRRLALTARRMRGELPTDPSATAWGSIEPVSVALTPLWWRDERIEEVEVRALHNGKALAFHLAWRDATQDQSTVKQQMFADGAAVQFASASHPPFFGMGDAEGPVQLWHWKASWQTDRVGWQDVEKTYPDAAVDWYEAQRDYHHGEPFEVSQAKTPSQDPAFMSGWGAGNPLSDPTRASAAEEAMAKGLGTFTSRPVGLQQVQANGLWRDGRWQLVLYRPLSSEPAEGEVALRPGRQVSVAFAVFDGHAGDRNGQKNVSIWNVLKLER